MAYAESTSVPADRSRAEIERILARYGATGFMYGTMAGRAIIIFEANDRRVKFVLPLPDPDAPEFRTTPTGRRRQGNAVNEAFEQEVRRRWRALALAIKAKLEAVETQITEFEDEFMAHIVMPDGKTVSEHTRPAIALAYQTGRMPALLPEY
jgi:hypothetical protein